ncbi:MAG TPA: hypothetical protein VGW35_26870 [Methylomirabilota bacterium]|jgi:hypothetical protein|nr:hypothetical protein [Methylomirabilota bacterium]
MSGEGLARLFIGVGFVWVVIVLAVGLLGGFDKPSAYWKFLTEATGAGWLPHVYLVLTLFVVPVGMLTFLRDILTDPVALWVKWAAPGAFLAMYAFFLLAAMPDVGRPLFVGIESTISPVASPASAAASMGSTGSWLVRFAVAFVVLAGVPGIIGAVVGLVTGSKAGVRRH